jgi:hypothetical protein
MREPRARRSRTARSLARHPLPGGEDTPVRPAHGPAAPPLENEPAGDRALAARPG